jgi:hypothetical protein
VPTPTRQRAREAVTFGGGDPSSRPRGARKRLPGAEPVAHLRAALAATSPPWRSRGVGDRKSLQLSRVQERPGPQRTRLQMKKWVRAGYLDRLISVGECDAAGATGVRPLARSAGFSVRSVSRPHPLAGLARGGLVCGDSEVVTAPIPRERSAIERAVSELQPELNHLIRVGGSNPSCGTHYLLLAQNAFPSERPWQGSGKVQNVQGLRPVELASLIGHHRPGFRTNSGASGVSGSELRTFNQEVLGSSPSALTNQIRHLGTVTAPWEAAGSCPRVCRRAIVPMRARRTAISASRCTMPAAADAENRYCAAVV